jgi:hypothetical protein
LRQSAAFKALYNTVLALGSRYLPNTGTSSGTGYNGAGDLFAEALSLLPRLLMTSDRGNLVNVQVSIPRFEKLDD